MREYQKNQKYIPILKRIGIIGNKKSISDILTHP